MAWADLKSMAHDDDRLYDLAKGMPDDYEPPEYPMGLQFSISKEDLSRAEAEGGEPGDTMRFAAMGEVTSIFKGRDDCRIEIQLGEFAGDNGKFFDLSAPSYISICSAELEKMGLEADCERGDMIHLIGVARMESSSSTEYGGDTAMLQIVEMTCEDESVESREG
jgi:hypothetical protein